MRVLPRRGHIFDFYHSCFSLVTADEKRIERTGRIRLPELLAEAVACEREFTRNAPVPRAPGQG